MALFAEHLNTAELKAKAETVVCDHCGAAVGVVCHTLARKIPLDYLAGTRFDKLPKYHPTRLAIAERLTNHEQNN